MDFTTGIRVHLRTERNGVQSDLIPCRVIWAEGHLLATEVDVRIVTGGDDIRLTLHYEDDRRRFVCEEIQVACISETNTCVQPQCDESPTEDQAHRVVCVFQRSDVVDDASQRECYRVRASSFGVQVECSAGKCELTEISQTGFSVICDRKVAPGAVLDVTVSREDIIVQGLVRVQSVRKLSDGRYRCGVICLGAETQRACAAFATELQRLQLRRAAGRSSEDVAAGHPGKRTFAGQHDRLKIFRP